MIRNQDAYTQIYNVGNPRATTICELAETIKKIGNFTSEIKFQSHKECFGDSYEDIDRRVPDISKLQTVTGWAPRTSLEEGLRKTIYYIMQITANSSSEQRVENIFH